MTGDSGDLMVMGTIKLGERYIVMYRADDEEQRVEALRQLGKWASHPDLSFTWNDAAVLSQRIRAEAKEDDRQRIVNRISKVQP